MANILLVEDEPNFAAILRDILHMHSHSVQLAPDGEAGWQVWEQGSFDLLLLDVMMPKLDGFSLARRIRETDADQPIIFLTARSQKTDVVTGLKLGADDYLTKPFDSEELLLRIDAILKRSNGRARQQPGALQVGNCVFHPRLHLLEWQHGEEKLSPKEAELLELLLEHKNGLLPRETALHRLWGEDTYFNARSMDVFISRLRKRLSHDPAIRIDNVHGKGFRLVAAT